MIQFSDFKKVTLKIMPLMMVFLLASLPAFAQDEAKEKAEEEEVKETVRTGLIAGAGSFASTGSLDIETGGAVPGDDASVISGGVSRLRDGFCEAKVTNTSEKNTYLVRFRVVGNQAIGGRRRTLRSYSARLSPQEVSTKRVNCTGYNAVGIDLRSAAKLKKE